MTKEIICIFCGNTADIVVHGESDVVACKHCSSSTDYLEYRRKLDSWLEEVRRK
jgi:hypothetical protein